MSNQIQINTVILPDGTTAIEINDGSKEDGHIEDLDSTLNHENSEVPNSLINECNQLANETGIIHFIFDKNIKNIINRNNKSIEEVRDSKIDEVLDEEVYYIGNESEFNGMPSRFSYYDTETKLVGRYIRYDYVLRFIKDFGFEPGFANYGPELEQSFYLNIDSGVIILRIQPNLHISLRRVDSEGDVRVYNGFFCKSRIYNYLKNIMGDSYLQSLVRDIKLKYLFEE